MVNTKTKVWIGVTVIVLIALLFLVPQINKFYFLDNPSCSNAFQINSIGTVFSRDSVNQGEKFSVPVVVENKRTTSGTMRVECGIYTESQVKQWGMLNILGSSSTDVTNCVSDETNVDTKLVTLPGRFGAGYIDTFTLSITAPTTSADDKYLIACNAAERCYKEDVNNCVSSYETRSIDLIGDQATATCTDGILNGDETDTDVGGSCPQKAWVGYRCNLNSDCVSGSECTNGVCQPTEITPPTPPPDPIIDPLDPVPVPLPIITPPDEVNLTNMFKYLFWIGLVIGLVGLYVVFRGKK